MRVADGWLRATHRPPERPRLPLAAAMGDRQRARLRERAAWQALQEAGPSDQFHRAQLAWRAARYALDLAAVPLPIEQGSRLPGRRRGAT